ncbi:HIG1 domain family member 2A [Mycena indigotica]|uniref:HIG1 domain family member 2A n=1 Tax=Mycena indigotica TaxID=2126181 RepID=A0A8H6S5S2_9AGAR|nr:HIG1 domain family member 2A [Mycena indigotica]KAF7292853.1 HIG1 domain family member 2A [Mycena indigotica]
MCLLAHSSLSETSSWPSVAMQGLTIVALLVGASRMGELDWGPDRFQRVVHWDLRQLLLQEQTAFWARKSAAQLMDEIETNVFGKGVMAKRDGELADVETSGGPKKSRGWLGGRGKSKPPPKVDDENAL